MHTPTYKEQFDKITRAYISDELFPLDNCACFIGNLLNGNIEWCAARYHPSQSDWRFELLPSFKQTSEDAVFNESDGLYSLIEVCRMEELFLNTYYKHGTNEDALFHAMESTLEMLKGIHEAKGEQVDPIPFTKRQLAQPC